MYICRNGEKGNLHEGSVPALMLNDKKNEKKKNINIEFQADFICIYCL